MITGKGTWKGSVEVGKALREVNPPLRRNKVLDGNSGRYSSMLVVDRAAVTALNPSGGTVLSGCPLDVEHWEITAMSKTLPPEPATGGQRSSSGLKEELTTTSNSVITAVLVTRGGDPACLAIERVAEVANVDIMAANDKRGEKPKGGHSVLRLVKVDISENPTICNEFGVKSIPTFLVFRGPELVYGGPLGGRKYKLVSRPYRPQILLIEPNFGRQLESEKLLKKMGCDPFLCISVQEATDRVRRFSLAGNQPIVFDLVLISQEVSPEGLRDLSKCLTDFVAEKKTIVAIMASALGEHGKNNLAAVDWTEHYTTEIEKLVSGDFCAAARCGILSPLKSLAIEKLLDMREDTSHSSVNELGLTPETLISRLNEIKEGKVKAPANMIRSSGSSTKPYLGIRMSAEDTKLRGGKKLVPI